MTHNPKLGSPRVTTKIQDEEGQRLQKSSDVKIDVYSPENPKSVINLCNQKIKKLAAEIPKELTEMSVEDLRKLVKPCAQLNQIRLSFWTEYDSTLTHDHRTILTSRLIRGICSESTFLRYIRDPFSLAWILTPITSYEKQMQETLETCMYKLRTVLDVELVRDGVLDTKAANLVMKVYEMFDKRINGDYKKNDTLTIEKKERPLTSIEILEQKKKLGI